MNISFIATIYNEEKNIEAFLDSLLLQTMLPSEVVITDGGSYDNTLSIINRYQKLFAMKDVAFYLIRKKGNRAIGRNEAIKHAKGDIIICSDSGNVLDKRWTEKIVLPFHNKSTAVVAGYYKGLPKTLFERCLIPYVLVMPDKVNSDTFLPATRSIAFRKAVWEKVGGFDEQFSHNEDYVFANKLRKNLINITFAKDAVVYWVPRKNIKEAFTMFFRFAYGDAEAKIFRLKVKMLLLRYSIALIFLVFMINIHSTLLLFLGFFFFFLYLLWAALKNYTYINDARAIFILPVLQLTADSAVIAGTLLGLYKLWVIQNTH